MRIVIVDDEPLARARLRAQLEDGKFGDVVGEAANGIDALRVIEDLAPQVVLLDIRMPEMDGLEAARHLMQLASPPAVIFTTAYDEHALAAFEANAVDYLLKPIRASRLTQALDKARVVSISQLDDIDADRENVVRTHISGMLGNKLHLVAVDEVIYFQADQGYVEVAWAGASMLIETSLRALEEEFPKEFMRVHRNALVGIRHVSGISRESNGNHSILLTGSEAELPVSRRLLQQVKERLR